MSILKQAPDGATVLDLGAARVARAEARAAAGSTGSFLKLTAGFVEVKPEFSLTVAMDFEAEKLREGLAGLLADPADVDVLLADGLTKEDLKAIGEFITGAPLGESSASPVSSLSITTS